MTGAIIRTFQADDPLRDVFVVGLDDDQELFHIASRAGSVLYARIVRDRETGSSRGFGFVRYATPEEARKGVKALNGLAVRSRILRASPLRAGRADASRAKEKRSS
jgi:RNA recognition motif-containing protein